MKKVQRKERKNQGKESTSTGEREEICLRVMEKVKFLSKIKSSSRLTKKNWGIKRKMFCYEPLRDSWTRGVVVAYTTQAHRPTDDCGGRRKFCLKNHSRRNERNHKDRSKMQKSFID